MSQPAPTINGFDFARDGGVLAGRIEAACLARLTDSGATTDGLDFEVRGFTNGAGRPALEVKAHGRATMLCQRCLEPVELPLAIDTELELRATLEEIEAADDDVDRALGTKSMDVFALVEDEAMLVLPMVPRHEGCTAPAEPPQAARPGKFAALERFKRQEH